MNRFVSASIIFLTLTTGVVLKADDYPPMPNQGSPRPPRGAATTTTTPSIIDQILSVLGITN